MKRCVFLLCVVVFTAMLLPFPVYSSPVSDKALGEQRILVIMVKFPDVKPSFSIDKMRSKYFDKLDRYVKNVSLGRAWITGKTTDWLTLPQGVRHYKISRHNLDVDKSRVTRLIQDSLDLVDETEDLSRYSMVFLSLGARHSDYGMMGLCGYPGMLGWQNELPLRTKKRGQEIPGGAAIYCENAHVGVVFHDMVHIMGGVQNGRRVVPCLYDHDLQATSGSFRGHYQFYLINVGFFDPMSCHFYDIKKGPPGVCAWTMLRLNWLTRAEVVEVPRGHEKTVDLGALNSGRSGLKVVRIPIDEHTYYLIENRQPAGADRALPSYGMLVYYCDDRIAECRHGKAPVKLENANPSVPELKGAPFTLKGNNVYKDEKRGVTVRIVEQSAEKFRVQVSNGA